MLVCVRLFAFVCVCEFRMGEGGDEGMCAFSRKRNDKRGIVRCCIDANQNLAVIEASAVQ